MNNTIVWIIIAVVAWIFLSQFIAAVICGGYDDTEKVLDMWGSVFLFPFILPYLPVVWFQRRGQRAVGIRPSDDAGDYIP